MASQTDVQQAVLDRIAQLTPEATPNGLLKLTEAFAWVISPNNAHGGPGTSS